MDQILRPWGWPVLTTELTVLQRQIVDARREQLAARIAWARSPNPDTIAAEVSATRWLNVLLDRLPRTDR